MAAIIFRRSLNLGLTEEHGRVLWMFVAAGILACFASAVRRQPAAIARSVSLRTVRFPALLIFPMLLFANGMMPYLGGKTETSFSMFSNLRTEGGISNHFLMPASLQIWTYQRDLVRVRHTTIDSIQRLADQGWQWTYFEFRSLVRRYPDDSVTYERHGVVITVDRIGADADLMAAENPLLRKAMYFRPVPINPAAPGCAH
jgi:hypothetical protein